MPLALESTTDNAAQALDDETAEEQTSTENPLASTGRTKALADLILRVTQANQRMLTADEFADLQDAYDYLDGVERYQLRTQLIRSQIYWCTTLENDKDSYDDDRQGYEVYSKIWNVAS